LQEEREYRLNGLCVFSKRT